MPTQKKPDGLLQQVATSAKEQCRLDPTIPLLIGVSGGPDSLCLAHALHALRFNIGIAHFDHQLRPESPADARFVQAWAQDHQLPFFLGTGDVRAFAQSQRQSIEEAARTLRYQFLFTSARDFNAQAVAVAHTADDQVETVLMHLLRGAGLFGLKGMAPISTNEGWDNTLPLVRPLLSVWRKDIERYCESEELHPILDATNADVTLYRNRLRHQLIPYLETYNPQIRSTLWRSSRVLAGDAETVDAAISQAWQTCFIEDGPGYVALDWSSLCAQPQGLQRNLLRKAFNLLRPGLRDLDFEVVERALRFLTSPTRSSTLSLALGLSLIHEHPRLYLAESIGHLPIPDAWPQIDQAVVVPLSAQLSLGRGWILECADSPQPWFSPNDPWQAHLDSATLAFPLFLRPPLPADRFKPLGLGGQSQKLSDFLINVGLPRRARSQWPLLLSGETIAWVPGFRPAEPFRTRHDTSRRLSIRLIHAPSTDPI